MYYWDFENREIVRVSTNTTLEIPFEEGDIFYTVILTDKRVGVLENLLFGTVEAVRSYIEKYDLSEFTIAISQYKVGVFYSLADLCIGLSTFLSLYTSVKGVQGLIDIFNIYAKVEPEGKCEYSIEYYDETVQDLLSYSFDTFEQLLNFINSNDTIYNSITNVIYYIDGTQYVAMCDIGLDGSFLESHIVTTDIVDLVSLFEQQWSDNKEV